VASTIAQISHGWRPFGDDAVVAWRAFNVFDAHGPLLGQFSQVTSVGSVHPIYDLGPSQYWLISIPTRLDTVHGALWGAALVCIAAVALSIEAGWSAARLTGGIAVSAGVLVFLTTYASVARDPIWNPYFGAVFLVATIATGWAVASGDLRWLPGLVATASITAQSHLVFLAPAGLIALIALTAGILCRRERSIRADAPWIAGAAVIGVGLWVAPSIQQLADRPGNLTLLVHGSGQRGVGFGTGLRAIWSFVRPVPVWAHGAGVSGPQVPVGRLLATVLSGSPVDGALVVALIATIAVVSIARGRTTLGSLAALVAAALVGTAWSISEIPSAQLSRLQYLDVVLWPVGIAAWGLVAYSLVAALAWSARFVGLRSRRAPDRPNHDWLARTSALAVVGLIALGAVGIRGDVSATGSDPNRSEALQLTAELSDAARAAAPHGPFLVSFAGTLPAAIYPPSLVEAVAFRLRLDGLDARFVANWQQIGPWVLPPPKAPELILHSTGGTTVRVTSCDPDRRHCVTR